MPARSIPSRNRWKCRRDRRLCPPASDVAALSRSVQVRGPMTLTTTGARVAADSRTRLLAELAAQPARKGYGIAYDLLGNRAEAEEAVQDALARACASIGDLRDPAAAPGGSLGRAHDR